MLLEFKKKLKKILNNINKLLIEKNKSYGNSYWQLRSEFGIITLIIRLQDKINRLKSLRNQEQYFGESIKDTLIDIIGYCLLELINLEGGNK